MGEMDQPARRSWRNLDNVGDDAPELGSDAPSGAQSPTETTVVDATQAAASINEPRDSADALGGVTQRAWWRRPWFIAGGAAVALTALAIALILIERSRSDDRVLAAASATPTFSNSTDASPTPTSTPSPSPIAPSEPASPLDDGIADDEYPAAAPSIGEGYPDALVMEDWVWQNVDAGWLLVSFAPPPQSDVLGDPTALYLSSPEGRLFLLGSLPADIGSFQAVSWTEDDHQARLENVVPGSTSKSIRVNLDTMDFEEMSFTIGSGKSRTQHFVTADASNNELWLMMDEAYSSSRLLRWSSASGWSDTGLGSDVVLSTPYPNMDHSAVAFEYSPVEWSGLAGSHAGHLGRPNLVIMDVETGGLTQLTPIYQESDSGCSLVGLTAQKQPVLSCISYDEEERYAESIFTVSSDGTLVPADSNSLAPALASSSTPDWTSPELGLRMVFLRDRGTLIRLESTADDSVILDAGRQLPYGGLVMPRLEAVGRDSVLVAGLNGCAVVAPGGEATTVVMTDGVAPALGCVPFQSVSTAH